MSEDEMTRGDVFSQVVGELQTRFSAVAQEVIAEHVRRARARMDAAPGRDYVLVLVQRRPG